MLKDCIPAIFAKTKQMEELFYAEQAELSMMEENVKSWINELNIGTCVNTIDRYENDYKIPYDHNLTLEQRRARIFAKKNQRVIPRKANLEIIIKNLLNADMVSIEEGNCEIKVNVATPGLINNMDIAKEWLRKIRPAHIAYTFNNQVKREHEIVGRAGVYSFTHKNIQVEVV